MLRSIIIPVLLKAITFAFILNLLPGLHFSGSFWTAIGYSFLFALCAFVVRFAILAATVSLGIATGGVGAIILIFFRIIGFWIIPALQLELLAHWFPKHFTVHTFGAAILGGLIFLIINLITNAIASTKK